MQDAIVIVRTGNKVGRFFDDRLGIFHCHSKSCIFDHGQVIVSVSAADHGICGQSDAVEKLLKRLRLVDISWHDLQEKGLGAVDV